MEPLQIGLPSDGLAIRDIRRDASGVSDRALFRLTKDGLVAETWVYAHEGHGFDGLTTFFQMMNQDWRGWSGERTWSALESDLRLTARHDGHIRLGVVLVDSINWSVQADLTLAPGEELSAAAEGLADLLA